jgi:signal transduction histidine kinase
LFDEPVPALIPFCYSLLSTVNLIVLRFSRSFKNFRFVQLLLTLLLPVLVMLALGGFVNGSAVILWGLLAPIGALLCGGSRQAFQWFLSYFALVLLSAFLQPYLRTENNLPHAVILSFFVINIGAVSTVIFLVLNYFVKQKDQFIELMRKNRELESAYLQQEVMLRQSEKLATLGKLSAGMAHELNNPAAAALRGSKQLNDTILKLEKIQLELGEMNLSDEQRTVLETYTQLIHEKAKQPTNLDPLSRSDREHEIEGWLEKRRIPDAWELAAMLVNVGLSMDELSGLAENFNADQFPTVINSLSHVYFTHGLLEEIGQGAGRISEIVKALKSYSYLDQAPMQSVHIHEGLNNTLVMLHSELKNGITVEREFAENLPFIQAYGNELNQVWTNIIDNAISAMDGKGKIIIKTFQEGDWIIVQIKDTGPGIPEDIQSKVFDPFFTTKAPGEGTGLGLNISYNIIVQKHKGKISVHSIPGETCFEVRLPLKLEEIQSKN